jgi:copper chaperone
MEFTIPAMSCGHCVRAITETLKATDPQALVTIDLASKHVSVQTSQPQSAVTAALAEAGYPVA